MNTSDELYPESYRGADNESKMMYDLELWHPELGEIPVEDFVLSYCSLFEPEDWMHFRNLKVKEHWTHREFRPPYYKEHLRGAFLGVIAATSIVLLVLFLTIWLWG